MSNTPWPHFSKDELACKCCDQMQMDPGFMTVLEDLRVAYGKPLKITSGYRCAKHNTEVAKTGTKGPHTTGKAVDIQIAGSDAHLLLTLALAKGFPRVGLSQAGS
ncbi:MAG: D-Ala-D-Ala carboxypeptidase family metallohydrolase, partial [Magnetococcus sp. YQC-5]